MPEVRFYDAWTMQLPLPQPFEELLTKQKKKRISCQEKDCSIHNKRSQGKSAKLHPPTLSAILGLIAIQEGDALGACGMQKHDPVYYCMLEYEKPEGTILLIYNRANGRFLGQRIQADTKQRLLAIGSGKSTGEEFLALLVYASTVPSGLYDGEFAENFELLKWQYENGWKEPKEALHAAYICCDNLYRRLTAPPEEAIPLERTQLCAETGVDFLSNFKIGIGMYAPDDYIWGNFQYLTVSKPGKRNRTIADMRKLYDCGWEVAAGSMDKIPTLPETYQVSEDVEEILQRIVDTPSRLFMLTGPAGVGKTTDVKIIAQVLGLPYYVFTCGPDTDELSLLASTVPNMRSAPEMDRTITFPTLKELVADPAMALAKTGEPLREGIGAMEAYRLLLEAAYQKGYHKAKSEKDFVLKESEIVKACREPCVLEIQEPATIEKPGTLVRLNSLFDEGACTDLMNGETLIRHPNAVIILTTNLTYAGCQEFNASVVSRMSLVQHREDLSARAMMQRVVERTGFSDEEILPFMVSTVQKIREYLENEDLQGGICGYRELESWVWSYMTTGDLLKAVKNTVISKAALLAEDRKILMDTFVMPHFCAYEEEKNDGIQRK